MKVFVPLVQGTRPTCQHDQFCCQLFFANRMRTIIFAEILKLDVCHYFPAKSDVGDVVVFRYRN